MRIFSFLILLTCLFASDYTLAIVQSEASVVLNGQLLKSKAHKISGHVYVDANEIGSILGWNSQNSGSTLIINTSQKLLTNKGGRISGVVTYYFNDNYGNKTDTGSKVYLIKYDSQFSPEINDYLREFVSDIRVSKNLREGGVSDGNQSFPIVATSAVDGNGHYELTGVGSGEYILIIISAHTKGNGMLNSGGKIYTKSIEVINGSDINISNDFGMSSR